jgi:hypothetical protein
LIPTLAHQIPAGGVLHFSTWISSPLNSGRVLFWIV